MQVIPGWQEVLQLMPAGSTYDVVIPPKLAYGERGSPGGIPPNATLQFKVELIEIQQAKKAAPKKEEAKKK
jgi:FKBP-type peptidyl-prolyl cis-trans isomerase